MFKLKKLLKKSLAVTCALAILLCGVPMFVAAEEAGTVTETIQITDSTGSGAAYHPGGSSNPKTFKASGISSDGWENNFRVVFNSAVDASDYDTVSFTFYIDDIDQYNVWKYHTYFYVGGVNAYYPMPTDLVEGNNTITLDLDIATKKGYDMSALTEVGLRSVHSNHWYTGYHHWTKCGFNSGWLNSDSVDFTFGIFDVAVNKVYTPNTVVELDAGAYNPWGTCAGNFNWANFSAFNYDTAVDISDYESLEFDIYVSDAEGLKSEVRTDNGNAVWTTFVVRFINSSGAMWHYSVSASNLETGFNHISIPVSSISSSHVSDLKQIYCYQESNSAAVVPSTNYMLGAVNFELVKTRPDLETVQPKIAWSYDNIFWSRTFENGGRNSPNSNNCAAIYAHVYNYNDGVGVDASDAEYVELDIYCSEDLTETSHSFWISSGNWADSGRRRATIAGLEEGWQHICLPISSFSAAGGEWSTVFSKSNVRTLFIESYFTSADTSVSEITVKFANLAFTNIPSMNNTHAVSVFENEGVFWTSLSATGNSSIANNAASYFPRVNDGAAVDTTKADYIEFDLWSDVAVTNNLKFWLSSNAWAESGRARYAFPTFNAGWNHIVININNYETTAEWAKAFDRADILGIFFDGTPETAEDVPLNLVFANVAFTTDTYEVIWANADGTVLETDEVVPGVVPEYNGETPVKAADGNTVYTFAGWDKEIVAATGDVTYTATYTSITYVAEVNGVKYESLAEAVAAATAGDTVTLLANAQGAGVVVDKDITIDFGGYTYELTEPVGSTGTASNGLQLLAGNNVVLKNGTLAVAEAAADKFYILVQNYSNLTVTDMILDGTYLDKYAFTDGDSYVLSNNSGTVNVNGATDIIANNDGALAFAFDVYYYEGYEAPVVNVATTGTIYGAIEVSDSIEGNLNISAGTFTVEVDETWCADGFAPVDNGDGTYSVDIKLPNATVSKMDKITLTEADAYMCWPSGDATIDRPLDVVVKFAAEDTLEECLAGAFSQWLCDFNIKFTGLAEGSITADDSYLAGNYGSFGWIVIPTDGLVIEEGVAYPVVANYDATLNYKDICNSVKEFIAAIHISDEILIANPDLQVELTLVMTNPDDATDTMIIGDPMVYNVEDLRECNIINSTTGVKYFDLAAAFADANDGDTITLLDNVTLEEAIVNTKNITLDLAGFTLDHTYACTSSYQMITNRGTLTITGNGKITFKDTGAGDPDFGWGSYTIYNYGTLIVENGTIENTSEFDFATHMFCAIQQYSGTTTINGGLISAPAYRSIRLNGGALIINDGEIDGQIWMQPFVDGSSIEINGGSFSPNGEDGSSVFVGNSSKAVALSVTGGNFATRIGCSDAAALAGSVTGGIYTEAAANGTSEDLLADGFTFAKNADGTYGIVEDYLIGDVNNDKAVDMIDLIALKNALLNADEYSYFADVDVDGDVDATDFATLKKNLWAAF